MTPLFINVKQSHYRKNTLLSMWFLLVGLGVCSCFMNKGASLFSHELMKWVKVPLLESTLKIFSPPYIFTHTQAHTLTHMYTQSKN